MIYIFDLDGTVVDTGHRYRNLPCGKIDLPFWFANSTEEMVAKDTLLPLADVWRRYKAEGHTVVVCTARSFEPRPDVALANPGATYRKYLADNDLRYDALLHRCLVPGHETLRDGELKTILLNNWAYHSGLPDDWRKDAFMFDDNQEVIAQMFRDKLFCGDAVKYNARLAA